MKLGMVGLGRMGGNIARRLMRAGHEVVVFDANTAAIKDLARDGAIAANNLEDFHAKCAEPKRALLSFTHKPPIQAVMWIMLPAGKPTEDTIRALGDLANPGDVIIDGGNTYYKDDIRRARVLASKPVHYIDVGTSGGVWGLERGYCMMIGGDEAVVRHLDPIFSALAPGMGAIPRTKERVNRDMRAENGYIHAGPAGAGHFVKMVHNGIEYGLMQAYAEGFDILKAKNSAVLPEDQRFDLNLVDIAEVWRRGSVVSSWLLDLTASALAKDDQLDGFSSQVSDSGEGQWTIEAAMEEKVSAHVLTASLFARYRSRVESTFGEKILSAMRFGFGGHAEHTPKKG